jgi:hypothetical protein
MNDYHPWICSVTKIPTPLIVLLLISPAGHPKLSTPSDARNVPELTLVAFQESSETQFTLTVTTS